MDTPEGGFEVWLDKDLVVAFKGGVPEAYDEMYRRYSPRVQMVCRRFLVSPEDAREATQETFLKAYLALPRFNGQYKLGAWLARIAANVCLDHLRRTARSASQTPLNESHEGAHLDPGPEDVVVRDIPALSALEDLQPLHAKALELRGLQGLSHREIADQLDMSPMQVKALLHRARASFKRAWENASGWALAPLAGLRHLLHQSSKDATGITVQVPVWTQTAGPLVLEKVAASAMVVAIAITGATASTPAPADPQMPHSGWARDPGRFAGAPADYPNVSVQDVRDRAAAAPDLVADATAILDEVRETAEDKTEQKKAQGKRRDEDDDTLDPTAPDRASQKLARKVNDATQDILPHR